MIFSFRSWRSLLLPLAVSIAFHAAIFALPSLLAVPRPLPRIEVRLPQPAPAHEDDLLKNTLVGKGGGMPHAADPGWNVRTSAEAQRRRLAEHVFYPPQAVAQGLQGEVRLLLRLDRDGRLLEVRIASSSGYPLLDDAAVAAARAAGVFSGGAPEMILPVVFRLSE